MASVPTYDAEIQPRGSTGRGQNAFGQHSAYGRNSRLRPRIFGRSSFHGSQTLMMAKTTRRAIRAARLALREISGALT